MIARDFDFIHAEFTAMEEVNRSVKVTFLWHCLRAESVHSPAGVVRPSPAGAVWPSSQKRQLGCYSLEQGEVLPPAGAREKFYNTSFPAPAQDSALAGYPSPASLSASPSSGEADREVWVAGTSW